MSQSSAVDDRSEPAGKKAPYDGTLQILCAVLTRPGSSFGLSLLVGGTWVSGTAVNGGDWFEKVGEEVSAATGGDWGVLFRSIGDRLYRSGEDAPDPATPAQPGAELAGQRSSFIHLVDARTFSAPREGVPSDGTNIRVRISEVQAWSVGAMNHSASH